MIIPISANFEEYLNSMKGNKLVAKYNIEMLALAEYAKQGLIVNSELTIFTGYHRSLTSDFDYMVNAGKKFEVINVFNGEENFDLSFLPYECKFSCYLKDEDNNYIFFYLQDSESFKKNFDIELVEA